MPSPLLDVFPFLARLTNGGLFRQLYRYLAVAVVALAADFSLLVACVEWFEIPVALAAAVGFCGGLTVNYALSIHWVFGVRTTMSWKVEFLIFAAIGWVGFWITELLLLLGSTLAIDYRLTKMFSVAVVFFWNFGLRRMLLVKRAKSRQAVHLGPPATLTETFAPLPLVTSEKSRLRRVRVRRWMARTD